MNVHFHAKSIFDWKLFQLIIFPQYVLKKSGNLSRANVQMCISLEIGLLKNLVISYKIVTVKPKMKQLI